MGLEILDKQYPATLNPSGKLALFLQWIDTGSHVLDVGCGAGALARELRRERGCAVVGIERDRAAAARAAEHCVRVVAGDAESIATWNEVERDRFDAVVFADVLEHLVDPVAALRFASASLKRDGRLLVCVPNVAHYSLRWQLLRGRFDYEEFGLLDSTHLRFFTRRTLVQVLSAAGFECVEIRTTRPGGHARLAASLGASAAHRVISDLARAVGDAVAPGLLAYQYVARARQIAG